MYRRPFHRFALAVACLGALLAAPSAKAEDTPARSKSQIEVGPALQLSTIFAPETSLFGWDLLIGAKIHRVLFGVGVDVHGESSRRHPDFSVATTSVGFVSDVQVSVLRSSDARVEMLALGGICIGKILTEKLPSEVSKFTSPVIAWRVAAGAQVWALPGLGLSLSTGITGSEVAYETPGDMRMSSATISPFGRLSIVGVLDL